MDKNKLILIIGAVLIVLALALSATSVIMTSNVLKKVSAVGLGTGEGTTDETTEVEKVPLAETLPFQLADSIIATLNSTEDPDKHMSVSMKIGFRIKDVKKTADLITLMTDNQGVITDRISKMLKKKTFEEYLTDGFIEQFQNDILVAISEEFDTELIVEVYGVALESIK